MPTTSVPFHHAMRTRLVFVCLAVAVVMLGFLFENTRRLLNDALQQHTEARANELTPLLNTALSGRLFERDYVTIIEIIEQLQTNPSAGFRYVVVYDDQHNIFANYGAVDVTDMPATDHSVHSGLPDGVYDRVSPLTLSGEIIGEVRYGLSVASFLQLRNTILTQSLLISVLGILLTIFLIGFAGYLVTRNINKLAKATQVISAGNYSKRVNISSKDEIGILAHNFNLMGEAIAERIDALSLSEQALFFEKERAEVTLHSIGDAVITTDTKNLVDYLNPVAEKLTGWTLNEAVGKPLDEIFCISEHTDSTVADNLTLNSGNKGTTSKPQKQNALTGRSGNTFPIEHTDTPIRNRNAEVIGTVVVFRDVSAAHELSRELRHQATHDSLTGLLNRDEFERQLDIALDNTTHNWRGHALCFLDLDHFKVINDTCGHIAGDELLRQIATLIKGVIRNSDVLARLGGDEFGILFLDCPIEIVETKTKLIRKVISEHLFLWKKQSYQVGVSIGVIPVRVDCGTIFDLLSAADVACYMAKEQGRNSICFSECNNDEQAQRLGEMHWPSRITTALRDNRFALHYQKIMPLSSSIKPVIDCELLVRMIDTDGTIIMPGSFIPSAERYRHMADIDRWVIHAALNAPQINSVNPAIENFSINLSGQSLGTEDFSEFVLKEIETSGVNPQRICFEITETAAIANLSSAAQFISALREKGCLIALDDFGSGLSSFAYLKNLTVDFLKIDGAFVKDIIEDPADRAIVESINQVAQIMGIKTIAEFIENTETQTLLTNMGIDYGQGYGIHKPAAISQIQSELLNYGT